jgi:tetratricopeptide (TPR) repeat protein
VETESRSYADLVKEADRLLERGRTRDAVVLLEKALGLRPGGHEALSGLGYAAFDKGSPARAMSYFRQALRASPAYPPALLGLAEAYELMGDRSKSLEAFRTCAARAPGTPEAATAQRKIQQLARMSQAP